MDESSIYLTSLRTGETFDGRRENQLEICLVGKAMRSLVIIGMALAASGCASSPNKIAAQYVSPMAYQGYDCEQIALEQNRIERRTNELHQSLKKQADADKWQMGVGLILFWPTLFMLEGGDGPEATEYARLRGEYNAISEVSIAKKCQLKFREDLGDVIKEQESPESIVAGAPSQKQQ